MTKNYDWDTDFDDEELDDWDYKPKIKTKSTTPKTASTIKSKSNTGSKKPFYKSVFFWCAVSFFLIITISLITVLVIKQNRKKSEQTVIAESKKEEKENPSSENNKEEEKSEEEPNGLEAIGEMQLEKHLFDVTLTIPEKYAGDVTQEELDQNVIENGWKSATINNDGSITYVMTKEQHKKMIDEMAADINQSLTEMIEEYPDITEIKANEDYSSFTITITSDNLGLEEGFLAIGLYLYGGIYAVFNGETPGNIHVDYVANTGEIVQSSDSDALKDIDYDELQNNNEEEKKGELYISNESGNTKNGDNIIIYISEITGYEDMSIEINNYDGALLTFIYIDNNLVHKDQYSNVYTYLDLKEENLSPGIHTIKTVQYENNDETENIIRSNEANYEVINY